MAWWVAGGILGNLVPLQKPIETARPWVKKMSQLLLLTFTILPKHLVSSVDSLPSAESFVLHIHSPLSSPQSHNTATKVLSGERWSLYVSVQENTRPCKTDVFSCGAIVPSTGYNQYTRVPTVFYTFVLGSAEGTKLSKFRINYQTSVG